MKNRDSEKNSFQVNAELTVSRQILHLIQKSAADIIYRLDADARIHSISEAVKSYGYSPEDFIGRNIFDLVHPEDREKAVYRLNERRTGERSTKDFKIRLLIKKAEHSESPEKNVTEAGIFSVNAQGLYQSEIPEPMSFAGTIGVVREEYADRQAKIREIESNIRQAHKMQTIGMLAGGIAHDFNNILFIITANAEIAKNMEAGDSRVQKFLDGILQASVRAKDLIAQILSFSRGNDQDFQPFRVQSLIKESLKLLRASIPKHIRIIENIGNDCPPVCCAPTQIYQVIMNLCTNAYQSMEETGGRMEVSLHEIEGALEETGNSKKLKQGKYLRLSVSDTGHGIAPELMDQIFDPFFTTKEKGKGTGLGLSVVYGIVAGHGGEITVSSEVGKGSVFSVYLPVAEIPAAKTVLPVPEPKTVNKGQERILLVDDEEQCVRMLSRMLSDMGYDVTSMTDSRNALELFRSQPANFDLVLTNLNMPGMTGDRLAREMEHIRPGIPLIFCTGFSECMEENSGEFRMCGLLVKPFSKKELGEMIRNVLQKKESPHNGT